MSKRRRRKRTNESAEVEVAFGAAVEGMYSGVSYYRMGYTVELECGRDV